MLLLFCVVKSDWDYTGNEYRGNSARGSSEAFGREFGFTGFTRLTG
jgi:hypothetical protein